MMLFTKFVSLCRNWFLRDRVEQDLDEELRSFTDLVADEHARRGVSAPLAQRAAQLELGGRDQVKERVRDVRTGARIETIWRDVAYGARVLARAPAFTLAAMLSLALGIGANTTILQLLNALTFSGLPVSDAGQLAQIRLQGEGRWGRQTGRNRQVSLPIWEQLRDHQQAFSGVLAFGDTRFNLAPQGEIRYVEGLWVSGSFFPVLGIRPTLGRLFTPEDDRPGCGYLGAVISHSLWQRDFGGRADVIGRALNVGTDRVPVIGVTPPEFFGVEVGRRFDVALPLCSSGFRLPNHFWLGVMGRLRPDASLTQANEHLRTLGPAILAETVPPTYRPDEAAKFRTMRFEAVDASSGVSPLRTSYERPLWVLMGIAGAVLLLAATNLANLMLARAAAREREFAVRLAIGGSQGRVMRQVIVEALLLAGAGALLGVWLARLASQALVRSIGTALDPIYLNLALDWRVLTLTTLVAGASVMCFGILPALRAASARATLPLQARGTTAGARSTGARPLIMVQVALSFVLVFGAGLFARSFQNLTSVDAGFRQEHIVMAHVFFRETDVPTEGRRSIYQELSDHLRTIPGVRDVAVTSAPPLSGSFWDTLIKVDGRDVGLANGNQVSPGYFRAMGMTLQAGRDFSDRDTASTARVAVVSEAFAVKFLDAGATEALGRIVACQTAVGQPDTSFEIVGVVGNSKYYSLREPFAPILFTADAQDPQPGTTRRFVLHTLSREADVIAEVKSYLARRHPTASLRFDLFEQRLKDSLIRERLIAWLSVSFGALALVLAAIGLYGVMSYSVSRRRGEFAVRTALGASRPQLVRMVLGDAMSMILAGLAVGGAAALLLGRSAESLLYGLESADPFTFIASIVTLLVTGVIAAFVPVYRAASASASAVLAEGV